MSQISLSRSERIGALLPFGYTEREAAFLGLAALHGGYFLRRQFCRFLRKENGGTVAALVEKVLVLHHATPATYANNTQVYHLNTRPFYALLGQADNRNRRQRQPFTIKNKLMGLDFVLARPEETFLATEQEKVDYFTGILQVPQCHLPVKLYRSQATREATARYFVDKYPLFFSGDEPGSLAVVSFCFVDEGATTPSHFETWLGQYSRLFGSLPQFRVVHVAATEAAGRVAESTFKKFFNQQHGGADMPPVEPSLRRLLDHFADRHRYDTKQLEWFDRTRLLQLREDREKFAGEKFDSLFERWKAEGDRCIIKTLAPDFAVRDGLLGTFSTHLLEYDYDIF